MINANIGCQYTFDDFEVTKANRKAFDLSVKFAKDETAKPLAIFGGVACGKTHLLYAVKNAIEQNLPEIKVVITTTAEMQSSLANILGSGGTVQQFREQYMSADVLLVDDIQELAGKYEIQNELVLIFNAFFESGKRFMMTSSQRAEQGDMNARLVCRSFWGEFAVISEPYVNVKFEDDSERIKKHLHIIVSSRRIFKVLVYDFDFDLEGFKSYFKTVWEYSIQYMESLIEHEDAEIISYLNRILTLIAFKSPSGIKSEERMACVCFLEALIYTLNFQCDSNTIYMLSPEEIRKSVTIDKFEEQFDWLCNYTDYFCGFNNNKHHKGSYERNKQLMKMLFSKNCPNLYLQIIQSFIHKSE